MPKNNDELDVFTPLNPKDFKTEEDEQVDPESVGMDDVLDKDGNSLEGDDQIDLGDIGDTAEGDEEDEDMGMGGDITGGDIGLGSDEVDPVGDAALDGIGGGDSKLGGLGGGLGGDDIKLEEPSVVDPGPGGAEKPDINIPKWSEEPQDNNDIVSKHVDGFMLRARPLTAKQGNKVKYAAQLFINNKILNKGTIWIEADTDARTYLQNVADRIISRLSI